MFGDCDWPSALEVALDCREGQHRAPLLTVAFPKWRGESEEAPALSCTQPLSLEELERETVSPSSVLFLR